MTASPADRPDTAVPPGEGWQRLHPLTPWLRGPAAVIVIIGLLVRIVTNTTPDNMDDLAEAGRGHWWSVALWLVVAVVVVIAAIIAYNLVWWRLARFRIGPDAVELHSGILARRFRSLRLDHLEAVDIVRPLLARLFGLAQLKLESAGGADSFLLLSYLTVAQADQVRKQILTRVNETATAPDQTQPDATSPDVTSPGAQLSSVTGPQPDLTPAPASPQFTIVPDQTAVRPEVSPVGPLLGTSPGVAGPPASTTPVQPGFQPDTPCVLTDPRLAPATFQSAVPVMPPSVAPDVPQPLTPALPTRIQRLTSSPSDLGPHLYRVPPNWTVRAFLRTWQPWTAVAVAAISIASMFSTTDLPGIIALLSVLAGMGKTFWKYLITEIHFTGYTQPGGIYLTHGLTTQVNQSIPATRVQALRLRQRRWWRHPDWWRIDLNIAGYGLSDPTSSNSYASNVLVPVADPAMARTALSAVMPGLVQDWELIDQAMHAPGPAEGFTGSPPSARRFDPLSWRRQGFARTDQAVILRGGWLTRTVTIIPHNCIQALTIQAGPWQRRRGLASLILHSTQSTVIPYARHFAAADIAGLVAAEVPLIDQPSSCCAQSQHPYQSER